MKKFLLWLLAFLITISAAYYQRRTGPTYPKKINVSVNDSVYEVKLVRSIDLSKRSQVRLKINDTTVKANLWFKRYNTTDEYQPVPFSFKTYPVKSYIMNNIFRINEETGLYAEVPKQPAAGKIQYYIELTDSKGTQTIMKESPVVIRFKGTVPPAILAPHILIMFFAMFFSTGAGLLAIAKVPSFKKIRHLDSGFTYGRGDDTWSPGSEICIRGALDRRAIWMGSH
jgi:hypothetical protein